MQNFNLANRPHLLDLPATRRAIAQTGIKLSDKAAITTLLMDHYVVDLDILATALGLSNKNHGSKPEIPHAA